MSDIYLQITETPTVVTLSAPVVSGALASTVTVANTVTVALDANSLSALENVTVTVGAAITGTVTIGNSVTISSLPSISGTVTANVGGIASGVTVPVRLYAEQISGPESGQDTLVVCDSVGQLLVNATVAGSSVLGYDGYAYVSVKPSVGSSVTIGNSVTISSLPAISGTVTANVLAGQYTTITASSVSIGSNSGLIDISNFPNGAILSVEAQPVGGANGVYKIQHIDGSGFGATDISVTNIFTGASAVNISASGTYSFRKNQFNTHLRFTYVSGTGVNASYKILAFSESYWNQTIPISISSVTVGNSVTIGSLPAISGTVTANTFALQGTAVTTSNFTSTTASTVLANYNATREVLTIFSEGPGQLFIAPGATCTTIAYQVRLSAGDYYEVPNHQTTITHSAVFATAGTARVTEVS